MATITSEYKKLVDELWEDRLQRMAADENSLVFPNVFSKLPPVYTQATITQQDFARARNFPAETISAGSLALVYSPVNSWFVVRERDHNADSPFAIVTDSTLLAAGNFDYLTVKLDSRMPEGVPKSYREPMPKPKFETHREPGQDADGRINGRFL